MCSLLLLLLLSLLSSATEFHQKEFSLTISLHVQSVKQHNNVSLNPQLCSTNSVQSNLSLVHVIHQFAFLLLLSLRVAPTKFLMTLLLVCFVYKHMAVSMPLAVTDLLLLNSRHGSFNVGANLSVCCAHEGDIQALTSLHMC